jgi:hypothetical protein
LIQAAQQQAVSEELLHIVLQFTSVLLNIPPHANVELIGALARKRLIVMRGVQ